MTIQSSEELEDFYKSDDPWGYEENESDRNRKDILLNEINKLSLPSSIKVLDIGCGHGFITRDLPGSKIVGVDISEKAIKHANKTSGSNRISYIAADMFNLTPETTKEKNGFDLIIITGVLYPQYIGESKTVIFSIIDKLLKPGGLLISVHINNWYTTKFPYVMLRNFAYEYREYQHIFEVYKKI